MSSHRRTWLGWGLCEGSADQQRATSEAMPCGHESGSGSRAPERPTAAATSDDAAPAQGRAPVSASQMQ